MWVQLLPLLGSTLCYPRWMGAFSIEIWATFCLWGPTIKDPVLHLWPALGSNMAAEPVRNFFLTLHWPESSLLIPSENASLPAWHSNLCKQPRPHPPNPTALGLTLFSAGTHLGGPISQWVEWCAYSWLPQATWESPKGRNHILFTLCPQCLVQRRLFINVWSVREGRRQCPHPESSDFTSSLPPLLLLVVKLGMRLGTG